MGRTAGATNKPKNGINDEGFDFDNTKIEGENQKTEKRGRPAGGKVSVEKEIIADKLNVLCEGIASIMGYEYAFSPLDYKKEALALANIAKIYPAVAKILEFFDPLLIIFGIFQKFKSMKKKPRENKQSKEQPKQQPIDNAYPTPDNPISHLSIVNTGR